MHDQNSLCFKPQKKEKIQGLGIIGTWIVKDENLFCLAVGRIIPASEVKQYITEIK